MTQLEQRASNAALVLKGVAFSSSGFKKSMYSMHLGKFKEGTRIIGIALTVGELIGALRRPVPWLRCPPVFFY